MKAEDDIAFTNLRSIWGAVSDQTAETGATLAQLQDVVRLSHEEIFMTFSRVDGDLATAQRRYDGHRVEINDLKELSRQEKERSEGQQRSLNCQDREMEGIHLHIARLEERIDAQDREIEELKEQACRCGQTTEEESESKLEVKPLCCFSFGLATKGACRILVHICPI